MHATTSTFQSWDAKYRLCFFHSALGPRSPWLIGTQSQAGVENLAIFSNVIHLGSNPPFVGVKFRPLAGARHTYHNLKANGACSLNLVPWPLVEQAHQTQLNVAEDVSEFELAGIAKAPCMHVKAPRVAQAALTLECTYEEEHRINANDTLLVVLAVQAVHVVNEAIDATGFIDHTRLGSAYVIGLEGYSQVQNVTRLPRPRLTS